MSKEHYPTERVHIIKSKEHVKDVIVIKCPNCGSCMDYDSCFWWVLDTDNHPTIERLDCHYCEASTHSRYVLVGEDYEENEDMMFYLDDFKEVSHEEITPLIWESVVNSFEPDSYAYCSIPRNKETELPF